MPGDGEMIAGSLESPRSGSLPLDRTIAPLSVWITGGFIGWLGVAWLGKKMNKPAAAQKEHSQEVP
jgi:hypothetical protein